MKILIAVDGSKASTEAAKAAAKLAHALAEPPTVVLMHADAPLMRRVVAELGLEESQRYHDSNSDHAMKGARAVLRRAGVEFTEKRSIGEAAPSIIKAAHAGKFDLLVLGSQGRSALKNLVVGSVATKVLSQSRVPVLVVP